MIVQAFQCYQTTQSGRNPPLPVRAAIIQLPLPAAAGSTASDRQKDIKLNAYRSRCKVKGAQSKDRLAALVQDKPP